MERLPEHVELYKQLFHHLGRGTRYANNFSTFVRGIFQRYIHWRKSGMRKRFAPIDKNIRQRPVITFVSVSEIKPTEDNNYAKYQPDIFYDAAFVSERHNVAQDFFLRERMRVHFPSMPEQEKDRLVDRVMHEIQPRELPKAKLVYGTSPAPQSHHQDYSHSEEVRRMKEQLRAADRNRKK